MSESAQTVVEKRVDAANQIWYKQEGKHLKIGFTEQFLPTVHEAWHVLPTTTKAKVREKSPLMAIETNDALFTIFAPSTGRVIKFNDKARDFPDRLSADDVILTLSEDEADDKPVSKKSAKIAIDVEAQQNMFAQMAAQAARPIPARPRADPPRGGGWGQFNFAAQVDPFAEEVGPAPVMDVDEIRQAAARAGERIVARQRERDQMQAARDRLAALQNREGQQPNAEPEF